MQIVDAAMFAVYELNDAVVIVPAMKVMPEKAQRLVLGQMAAIAEYLQRYLHGRANGQDMPTAHKEAASSVGVILRHRSS